MIPRLKPVSTTLEAGLIGLFFIQALRYVIGGLYSRIASAGLVTAYPADSYNPTLPGIVDPAVVNNEVMLLGAVIALPLLALVLGRWRWMALIAGGLVIFGRAAITFPLAGLSPVMASALTVGAGLLFIAVMIAQRARLLPYLFVIGFGLEQIVRAFGNTLDPTLFAQSAVVSLNLGFGLLVIDFFTVLVILLALAAVLLVLGVVWDPIQEVDNNDSSVDADRGLLTIWGALGLGGLFYLQLALLALPNAIGGRADGDYSSLVPLVLVATLLPIIPFVRSQARSFLAPFEATTRGWVWLILIALMLVIGTRLPRLVVPGIGALPLGAIALVIAQFAASMIWWWFARPKGESERDLSGLWLVVTVIVFGLLVGGDVFTFEYAFVRPFFIAGDPALTDALNAAILPLLRGFRGLGLGLLLLATLLSTLPMIQATRRIPWKGGSAVTSLLSGVLVIAWAALGIVAARPPQAEALTNPETLRIGTFNIHSGYSEFYNYDLAAIASDIEFSGAGVMLLQEVESGRLTSFGVDQSLWLARRLGMLRRFYPTNEGLFGLAVLSRVPIAFDDGVLLPSMDRQTGLQRVQVQPGDDLNTVITLYNTELGLLLQGRGLVELEANQRNQLQAIISTIETQRINDYGGQLGRTILGGTFHNVPGSALMNIPRSYGFTDPFAGTNLELTATLNRSNLPPARYDYLWVWQQSLQQVGTGVVPSVASDHRLAYVEFQISQDD